MHHPDHEDAHRGVVCPGLLMPGDRKSVEPMAAVTAPSRVAVTLSMANRAASMPVRYRSYPPQDWAAEPDTARR